MTLGAIQDKNLVYQMSAKIAEDCHRMGINWDFAPVVDVNTNPNNPIIGNRSFGSEVDNVISSALSYSNGLQDNNILAAIKHFPGHGDTSTDSHLDLPVVPHNMDRLNTIELAPFKALMNKGIGGVMVAHLYVPLMKDLTGTFTAADKYVLNADISIEKTDVVLVYRKVGTAWQQIPKTVYVDPSTSASPRKFDYNFVFDNQLVQVRIDDANFNLGSMSSAEASNYLTNQTFRIVLVFANAGKSAGKSAAKANVDYSDYNAVVKYYNLDESKVQTVNVK